MDLGTAIGFGILALIIVGVVVGVFAINALERKHNNRPGHT